MSALPRSRPAPVRSELVLSGGGADVHEVTVRPAETRDIAAMHALSMPFVASGDLITRDLEMFAELVEDFRVVEIDRTVVACAGVRRFIDIAEIVNVAVDTRWHGLGLGRLLLASIMVEMEAEGFARVAIFSRTATAWFGRYGFVPIDPSCLPDHRLALVDPGRGSVLMARDTVRAEDGVEALPQLGPVRVRYCRSRVEHSWDGEEDALLPFTERRGIDVDSLCWSGLCGTCSTRLRRGTVNYHVEPGIEPEPGEILLCISRPVTDVELEL